jgi:two-component system response regulator HydG
MSDNESSEVSRHSNLTHEDGQQSPHPRRRFPSVLDDGGIIGWSDAMRRLGQLLTKVADTDTTVLVSGESGTGKELVARVLHTRSRRAQGPFVAVNCAALPETLLESELFGHVRGAFTHAVTDQKGLFERASGGTLFLDELGEIAPGVQAKLLRVLQERAVRQVGGATEKPIDVRLVAATNRDLEQDVRAGRFREDLYYRVNVVSVDVPPLRERDDDVLLLAQHFIERIATRAKRDVRVLSSEAADALLAYNWPGNVRELDNCMERAVALADGEWIEVEHLPPKIQRALDLRTTVPPIVDPGALPQLWEVERRYICHVLKHSQYNKTLAAKVLGIDRRTLHRKLKTMGEPVEDDSPSPLSPRK